MFKINYDIQKAKEKKLINPEDLLPQKVETTDGKISPFNAQNIIDSLIRETELESQLAIQVTTNVLRKLSGLGMAFIAAPHLRELVCGELTAMGLHQYRNHYTRLGIPIYDVKRMLKDRAGSTFSTLLSAQVIEQFVHLDRLSEDAQIVVEEISKYAEDLPQTEREIINKAMENALRLYNSKKNHNLV